MGPLVDVVDVDAGLQVLCMCQSEWAPDAGRRRLRIARIGFYR